MDASLTVTSQLAAQATPSAHNQPIIQIGLIESVIGIAVLIFGIGVAWGTTRTQIKQIAITLKDTIEPDLQDMRERVVVIEAKVNIVWRDHLATAHSPRQLNDTGKIILEESGIKEIVADKKAELLAKIKAQSPANPYDAEQVIFTVLQDLPKQHPEIVDRLKDGAFKTGSDITSVLFVGSIYLRNLIFKDLGFTVDDAHKPQS